MDDLQSLYQEMILEHKRKPRNFRTMEAATQKAEGYNPLCGDQLTLFLRVEGGIIQEAAFQGSGCAISTASASIMTETLVGKSEAEAHQIFQTFHALITDAPPPEPRSPLGKLAAFEGVKAFPMRVKCATLAWHTLEAALAGEGSSVTTE